MSPEIEKAAALLRQGELVAFPTETVYGLGADASNPEAVAKIFAAKGRPVDHPLIVHLPGVEHLDRWAREIPETAYALAKAFWPGPLTLILKRQPNVPDAVTGGQDTVGVRVPGHPLALELLKAFDGGVAAPSANRFGHVSPTTAQHVHDELGERGNNSVAMVLDGGPCRVGIESTIVDLTGPQSRILRPGMISAADLGRVLGRAPGTGGESAPRVSGSLESHYAPSTDLALLQPDVVIFAVREALAADQRIGVIAPMASPLSDERIVWRQISGEAAGFAHDIYALLRELDGLGLSRIVVQKPPQAENWRAINDRLQRAVAGSGAG
ncbi:MAG: threonylcarbamoyl-AMP synthase [Gammaproteobacteria bacterium]|nr:threonylcarbamoyl-AMP synthase [Gammaproteobacteria bacterium]MBU1415192.1 threonylcarbamoyl-AMP synthase [Gammaproteobacteria bacterium]